MEVVMQIIYYCIAALVVAVSTVSTVIAMIKAKKRGKSIDFYDTLRGNMRKYMSAAETVMESYKTVVGVNVGEMKLNEVLTKLKLDCLTNGKSFDEAFWRKEIEEEIELSKKLNVKSTNVD